MRTRQSTKSPRKSPQRCRKGPKPKPQSPTRLQGGVWSLSKKKEATATTALSPGRSNKPFDGLSGYKSSPRKSSSPTRHADSGMKAEEKAGDGNFYFLQQENRNSRRPTYKEGFFSVKELMTYLKGEKLQWALEDLLEGVEVPQQPPNGAYSLLTFPVENANEVYVLAKKNRWWSTVDEVLVTSTSRDDFKRQIKSTCDLSQEEFDELLETGYLEGMDIEGELLWEMTICRFARVKGK